MENVDELRAISWINQNNKSTINCLCRRITKRYACRTNDSEEFKWLIIHYHLAIKVTYVWTLNEQISLEAATLTTTPGKIALQLSRAQSLNWMVNSPISLIRSTYLTLIRCNVDFVHPSLAAITFRKKETAMGACRLHNHAKSNKICFLCVSLFQSGVFSLLFSSHRHDPFSQFRFSTHTHTKHIISTIINKTCVNCLPGNKLRIFCLFYLLFSILFILGHFTYAYEFRYRHSKSNE